MSNKKHEGKTFPAIRPTAAVPVDVPAEPADALCPSCGVPVETHRCRLCGATRSLNSVSGNVIWMNNGRVVEAFHDAKSAYVAMAQRYGIPETEWPVKFRK
jgi:hypothetical protein